MPVDRYTKCILTIIAAALSVIAARGAIEPARAIGDGCGDKLLPCYVEIRGQPVRVIGPVEVFGTVITAN